MLSIVEINNNKSIPKKEKFKFFVDWMICKFRKSLATIVYASLFFGDKPLKRMMKYKSSQSIEEKRQSINNMTWDLYIISQFFKKWINKDKDEEFLYASDDNAFCALLRKAIQVQKTLTLEPLKDYMSQSDYQFSLRLLDNSQGTLNRVYTSKEWGPEYRANLIKEFESKVLF